MIFDMYDCRYVQLPVNVGMREAWEQTWQPLRAQSAAAAGAVSQPDRQILFTSSLSCAVWTGHHGMLQS